MKAVLTALAAALLPTVAVAQSPSNAAIEQILVERIDTAEQNVGIAVAVIENGVPRFVSYGHPALGDAKKIDEHTVFEIGSVTKLFTNVLLAQEVLAGKIDLDAPIVKGAVVLSNMASAAGIEDIGFHIIAESLPLTPMPKVRQAAEIDPALLDRLVGKYALTPAFVLEVTREGGALFVQATGQQKLPVFAENETTFFYRAVDAQLSFGLGADGKAKSLKLHQGGTSQPGQRIE
ncbi:MAG TPA: serine hydrolase [Devosia sp.]|jgi:hypothetical protein|uniref:serine hydrolase n=1 Tax=Devosia sp. TaxID=1871048 RepID=UPI002DDCE975|nr:serine hydrolase [Devosia sp.]HEV2517757.1 serine hydrolase [Devosia sp.]